MEMKPVVVRSRKYGEHTYSAKDGWIVMDGNTRVCSLEWYSTPERVETACRRHWKAYCRKLLEWSKGS